MNGVMFKRLENKYGVRIRHDGIKWTNTRREPTTLYKIYTADGCSWENGLTYKGVLMECKRWAKELLDIKSNYENARRK